MNGYNKVILLFFAVALLCSNAFSQSKESLERQRKEKEREIAFTKNLIEETNEKQRETVDYLKLLNRQIEVREELISAINNEIDFLASNIVQNQDIINALENDLQVLREEYAKMIRFQYKTRSLYNKLGFIFSADNFNQAFKRLKFLQYYSRYRHTQVELILKTQQSLQTKVEELEHQRKEKEQLLAKEQKEKQSLMADLSSKRELVDKLQGKEKELKAELARQQKVAEQLNKAIEELIKREMEKTAPGKSTEYALTPEAKLISGEFEKNKNRLPWPVERGFVSEKFGDHPHPTLHGVVTSNNGINIRTNKGALARAVFDGEVRNVVNLRGAGLAVLIRHGEYYTVYSNLSDVYVKPGAKIEALDEIGLVYSDPKNNETELHMEIWKSRDKLNPEDWLLKR